MDPLEKIMQEFEAASATMYSAPTAPPPTELPHRPIMLPTEIKDEPMETANAQVASKAQEDVPADKQSEVSQNAAHTVNLPGDGNQPEQALLAAPQSTDCAANSTLAARDPITTEIIASNAVALATISTNSVANSTATPPVLNSTPEVHDAVITTTTTTIMPDSVLRVKREALEDGELTDEGSHESATAKSAQAPAKEQQQEGELVTRIKPEPIDQAVTPITTDERPTTAPMKAGLTIASFATDPIANQNTESAEPDETLPDNFFDDLLQNADDITKAALHAPIPPPPAEAAPHTPIKVKSEAMLKAPDPEPLQNAPIPENFFDDLLVDHVAERVEDVVNHNLEQKFSERLKELKQLEAEASNKAHKKHKKKKKKSHKRSRAEAMDESPDGKHKRSKRREIANDIPMQPLHSLYPQPPTRKRIKSEFSNVPVETINLDDDEEPSTSTAAAAAATAKAKQSTQLAPTGRLRIKSEFATFPIEPPTYEEVAPDISLPVRESEIFQRRSNVNRNGLIVDMTAPLGFKRIKMEKDADKTRELPSKKLLPAEKMERAKQRALDAIEAFKNAAKQEKEPMSAFIYTTTLRKLPHSYSYLKQQIYENRSPLNNVNNVSYKFNSHAFRFNLYEWGIEEMPRGAAKVAKVLGFDYYALLKKMETFKIPLKLQKIKKEEMELQSEEQKKFLPQSSFLITVATQTNEVTVLDSIAQRRKNGHDIGVQAIPPCESFGTQTLCLSSTSYDELPLMRQISTLNENQLIALSDFVDLISEPVKPETSAIDLYRLRQRLVDIYKCSQEPSALAPTIQKPQQQEHQKQQLTQQPVITNSNTNPRDPRIRVKAPSAVAEALDDEPPPPPPSVHLTQQRSKAPQESKHRPSANTQQKIPVISNVQSYHPSAVLLPPQSTLDASTSRYYGRGGMRR